VVGHLEANNIGYKFLVDDHGIHHYKFDRMIDLYEPGKEVKIDRKFVENYDMPKLKREHPQIKFIAEDQQIEQLKKEIAELELRKEKCKEITWKQKVWSYLWFPYSNKLKNDIKNTIAKIEKQIKDKKDDIKEIEFDKKNMQEMLILADVVPEDTEDTENKKKAEKVTSALHESLEILKNLDRESYKDAKRIIEMIEQNT
jgi:hypothetical protein